MDKHSDIEISKSSLTISYFHLYEKNMHLFSAIVNTGIIYSYKVYYR